MANLFRLRTNPSCVRTCGGLAVNAVPLALTGWRLTQTPYNFICVIRVIRGRLPLGLSLLDELRLPCDLQCLK